MMNKIIYLLIDPKSWCKLEEASPKFPTSLPMRGVDFFHPNAFSSPDFKSKPALMYRIRGPTVVSEVSAHGTGIFNK